MSDHVQPLPLSTPRAVLFDVDYTLLKPNDMFRAEGYRRMGERFGLALDVTRWGTAEAAAYAAVKARRAELGLVHDDGIYNAIAAAVITGLGGGDPETVAACARAVIAEWTRCENFTLYPDVLPCLERLRAAGMRIGLVSNTNRDLSEVLEYFYLGTHIDAAVTSFEVGMMKPAPEIFMAALETLRARAVETVMVGDSIGDDVKGAAACGLAGAVLIDRDGRWDYPVTTIRSLAELPAALGL